MPSYRNVTKENLDSLLSTVRQYLNDNPTFPVICLCLIWLYEYCFCMSYMITNNITIIQDRVITLTSIKNTLALRSTDNFSFTLTNMLHIRNGLAHGDVRLLKTARIPVLLNDKNFYRILDLFGVSKDVCTALQSFDEFPYFNAKDYLELKLNEKVHLLPSASVSDCHSIKDCEDLISTVSYLL